MSNLLLAASSLSDKVYDAFAWGAAGLLVILLSCVLAEWLLGRCGK